MPNKFEICFINDRSLLNHYTADRSFDISGLITIEKVYSANKKMNHNNKTNTKIVVK